MDEINKETVGFISKGIKLCKGLSMKFQKTASSYPVFSVVTPSYNQGRFIEEAINSVLSQEGDFYIDYVIVDGASTDNTFEIIRKYDQLLKDNKYFIRCRGIAFRWISERDRGHYHAVNKGFSMTGGEIMAWINSDDKYAPWAFKTVADVCSRFPKVEWLTGMHASWNAKGMMVGVAADIFFTKRLILNGFYPLEKRCFIQQESTFWKRSVWEKAGGKIDENMRLAGDFKLWVAFLKYAKLYKVHAILGGFRSHSGQKTASMMDEYMDEVRNILVKTEKNIKPCDDKTYYLLYSFKKEDWILKQRIINEDDARKK